MTMVDIKDLDQAQKLSVDLGASINELESLVKAQLSVADSVLVFTQTVSLNEQASRYFKESAEEIKKLIPQLETVKKQLDNAINCMLQFEEMNKQNILGQV